MFRAGVFEIVQTSLVVLFDALMVKRLIWSGVMVFEGGTIEREVVMTAKLLGSGGSNRVAKHDLPRQFLWARP